MFSKVAFYKEIYDTRDDYKRDLTPMFEDICRYLSFKPARVLDYGCGLGNLADLFAQHQNAQIAKYDPAIERYATLPTGHFDLLLNTDVLEHIPEEEITPLLLQMKQFGEHAFFNIHLSLAGEILSNGENAHCTVQPACWWLSKVREVFPEARLVATFHPRLYAESCSIITWHPGLKMLCLSTLLLLLRGAKKRTRTLLRHLLIRNARSV